MTGRHKSRRSTAGVVNLAQQLRERPARVHTSSCGIEPSCTLIHISSCMDLLLTRAGLNWQPAHSRDLLLTRRGSRGQRRALWRGQKQSHADWIIARRTAQMTKRVFFCCFNFLFFLPRRAFVPPLPFFLTQFNQSALPPIHTKISSTPGDDARQNNYRHESEARSRREPWKRWLIAETRTAVCF